VYVAILGIVLLVPAADIGDVVGCAVRALASLDLKIIRE
jgi:hypothetical protein